MYVLLFQWCRFEASESLAKKTGCGRHYVDSMFLVSLNENGFFLVNEQTHSTLCNSLYYCVCSAVRLKWTIMYRCCMILQVHLPTVEKLVSSQN